MKKIILAATLFAAMLAADTAAAQHASHGRMPRKVHRQRHQIHRIHGGVRDGQLTNKEARQLEREQKNIDDSKRAARRDGVVTPAEKRDLDRQQNAADRHIYNKKHNAAIRH